jgi:RNA-directed DNA polymerase
MLVRCRGSPPPKVGKLQTALHTKAKNSPRYRLYVLYDKLDREDMLGHAYRSSSLVDAAARRSRRWFQGKAAARTAFV